MLIILIMCWYSHNVHKKVRIRHVSGALKHEKLYRSLVHFIPDILGILFAACAHFFRATIAATEAFPKCETMSSTHRVSRHMRKEGQQITHGPLLATMMNSFVRRFFRGMRYIGSFEWVRYTFYKACSNLKWTYRPQGLARSIDLLEQRRYLIWMPPEWQLWIERIISNASRWLVVFTVENLMMVWCLSGLLY